MYTFLRLVKADMTRVFRDHMMWIFLLLPLVLIPILRWGVPFVGDYWPVFRTYDALSVGMMAVVTAASPALLVALLMLDEKDQHIFEVLRVMPISVGTFLAYRIGCVAVFGGIMGMATLILSGLYVYSLGQLLLLSLLLALAGPLIPLVIVAVARNKIEGVALLKAVNFAMGFPIMLMLLAPNWEILSGIIPFYWIYKSLILIHDGNPYMWGIEAGLGMTMLALFMGYRLFRRRVFSIS